MTGPGRSPSTGLQKGFSLLCHVAHTMPHATHASRGCSIQASPSDQAAAPHPQKLALNTPQKAVHGPVWLWNDEVTVRINVPSISHAPGATSTLPALTLPWAVSRLDNSFLCCTRQDYLIVVCSLAPGDITDFKVSRTLGCQSQPLLAH